MSKVGLCLFDRKSANGLVFKAMTAYAPITGAANALQAWKTAVLKNGGQRSLQEKSQNT